MRFGKDPDKLVLAERIQLDPYGKPSLEFGDEVRWLGDVKGACGYEKNMISLHLAVFCVDCRSLDNGQKVSLDALPGYIRPAVSLGLACYFIYLVKENDPGLFRPLPRFPGNFSHINKLVRFLLGKHNQCLGDPDLFPF